MTKERALTLEALRVMDAIDRRGSFAAAADELGRVPSALSYTMQKLEEELDVVLFDRSGHRTKFTHVGRMLLERGRVLLEAADKLSEEGASVEVVDLRTLVPLDRETVCQSVRKTNKVLLLHEDTRTGGMAGELAASITESVWEDLDGPILRVTAPDTPVPYSPPLEDAFLPNARKVVEKARWLWRY